MERYMIFLCIVWALSVFAQETGHLADGLQSPRAQIQLQTLAILEKQRHDDLVPGVVSLLSSKKPDVRRRAATVLGAWRERNASPQLLCRLSDPDKWVRAAAVWALGEIADQNTLPELLKTTEDSTWEVRCAAISSLGNFSHGRVCKKLKIGLFDNSWQVRYASAVQLGKLRCTHCLPELAQLSQNKSEKEEVSAAACRALGKIASPTSLFTLLTCLEDKRPQVARESDIALSKIAPKCRPKILQIFQDHRRPMETRYDIALVLGRIHATEAIPILFKTAKDESEKGEIRYISLVLLADFSPRRALPLFIKYARAKDPWLQRGAIAGLGRIKTPETFDCLVALLKSADSAIGEKSLSAIASFESEQVEAFVLRELERHSDDRLTRAAVRLAGTMKMKKALPKLREICKDPRWREIANWALKSIQRR